MAHIVKSSTETRCVAGEETRSKMLFVEHPNRSPPTSPDHQPSPPDRE